MPHSVTIDHHVSGSRRVTDWIAMNVSTFADPLDMNHSASAVGTTASTTSGSHAIGFGTASGARSTTAFTPRPRAAQRQT